MKIDMDYEIRPIWDVIGTIAGSESPNEKVIIGNHRDAWVYGAVDPNSGTASLLETARGLGELLRSGWQPKRTIVLCSWDGEEFGLIGSTEWGEQNAADLSRNAVAYVNVDAPVSGTNFGSSAVPSLDRFVMDITKSVSDPKTGKSVFDVWYMNQNKNYFKRHTEVPDTATTRLGRLGSGSDYTVFLDHLGVPSFDFGFGGPYGVYHSMLDDFYWMEHWGDPTFEYHATVARLIGIAAMRLADDRLLPLRYSDYAEQISNYLQERKKKASENDGVKGVSFSEAESSTARFVAATRTLDSLLAQQSQTASSKVNAGLMEIERTFTNDAGLPQSPWFKHQIYAPGFYTGYGSEPLPGIDRAIDSAKPGELEGQLKILFDDLGNASNVAERLITELEGR